jgi:hypothetical protein
MSLEEKRFVDDGVPLGWYRKEVFCVCPNCGGPALACGEFRSTIPSRIETARVQCLRCSFNRDLGRNDIEWKGPVIGMVCQRRSNCGYKWLTAEVWKERYSSRIKQTIRLECPACHEMSDLKLGWIEDRYTRRPFDPYFGFPLWLQAETCGQVLWAYNKDHLHAIRAYIGAAHRERAEDGKWSMMTRLPKWMKSARNRDALLKSIERLEGKLEAIRR